MGTRTRRPERLTSVGPLPDQLLSLAPKVVAKASEAFCEALDRLDTARATLGQAEAAATAAGHSDRAAAKQAALAGDPAPAPTVGDAEAQLHEARRAAEAANGAAVEFQARFLDQLIEHRDSLLKAGEKRLAEIDTEAGAHIEAIEALYGERALPLQLLRELEDPEALEGRTAHFWPRTSRTRDRGQRNFVDGLRAHFDGPPKRRAGFFPGRSNWGQRQADKDGE